MGSSNIFEKKVKTMGKPQENDDLSSTILDSPSVPHGTRHEHARRKKSSRDAQREPETPSNAPEKTKQRDGENRTKSQDGEEAQASSKILNP